MSLLFLFFMPFLGKTGLNSYIVSNFSAVSTSCVVSKTTGFHDLMSAIWQGVSKNFGVSEFWLQKERQNILFEREEIRYCEIVPKRARAKGEQHE